MAKAKAKRSTKPSSEIRTLSVLFDQIMPEYLRAYRLNSRLYRKWDKIITRKFEDIDELRKEAQFDVIDARNTVMDEVGEKTGYFEAAKKWQRLDCVLNKLAKQIIAVTPTRYEDLAIQVKAYSFLTYDYVIDARNEKENFMLRFAKFAGVKIHVHSPF
jgi:hypothetical protein